MAMQSINLGTAPGGTDGDTVRTAFGKCASNDAELDGRVTAAQSKANSSIQMGVINNGGGTALASSAPPNISIINSSDNTRKVALQISNAGNNYASAVIGFVREGSFGAFIGLDNDNTWKVGGWSMGSVAYRLWHEGNTVVDANNFIKKV